MLWRQKDFQSWKAFAQLESESSAKTLVRPLSPTSVSLSLSLSVSLSLSQKRAQSPLAYIFPKVFFLFRSLGTFPSDRAFWIRSRRRLPDCCAVLWFLLCMKPCLLRERKQLPQKKLDGCEFDSDLWTCVLLLARAPCTGVWVWVFGETARTKFFVNFIWPNFNNCFFFSFFFFFFWLSKIQNTRASYNYLLTNWEIKKQRKERDSRKSGKQHKGRAVFGCGACVVSWLD